MGEYSGEELREEYTRLCDEVVRLSYMLITEGEEGFYCDDEQSKSEELPFLSELVGELGALLEQYTGYSKEEVWPKK